MSSITIRDLSLAEPLERRALSRLRGAGGAGWVFGWIRPWVPAAPVMPAVLNFYQTNNFFVADQINAQMQVVEVNNSAASANINVNANQLGANIQAAAAAA